MGSCGEFVDKTGTDADADSLLYVCTIAAAEPVLTSAVVSSFSVNREVVVCALNLLLTCIDVEREFCGSCALDPYSLLLVSVEVSVYRSSARFEQI